MVMEEFSRIATVTTEFVWGLETLLLLLLPLNSGPLMGLTARHKWNLGAMPLELD